jgi:16S rRNA (cytidine1402-2'-O)-methyltransferase
LAEDSRTVAIYESPKRLARTLRQLGEFFGTDRDAAVCREISKLHETIHRGTIGELENYFTENQPRGEIVIVISGKSGKVKNIDSELTDDDEMLLT